MVVTLTTDFGYTDFYVAQVKGVLLRGCPGVTIVDVTHGVRPGDVVAGAVAVERAVAAFPPGTVHVAVVDPGVGTGRRLLAVELAAQVVLLPDNGLITWAWRRVGGAVARELTWRPAGAVSDTFHGRDILAPAAARVAAGAAPAELCGAVVHDPVLLDLAPVPQGATAGRIIYVDHYGNAMTNVPADVVAGRRGRVRVGVHDVGPVRRTYADVATGEPLALIGSSDLLEVAVRDGSAAANLGVRSGDEVRIV